MRRKSPWSVLGIQRTNDLDAIRRAYTRLLKVTNPEDDAAAFQQLREAYEEAVQRAARHEDRVSIDPILEPQVDLAVGHDSSAAASEPDAPSAPRPYLAELQDQFRRFAALLEDDAATEQARLDALQRLCSSTGLDDLTVRLDLELSLAHLLLTHTPRSNRLITQAAEIFRWRSHSLGSPPVIEQAAKCAAAIAYIERLRSGRHPLSDAYAALTTAPSHRALLIKANFGLATKVKQLQSFLRIELALARPELNADAVEWWEGYLAKPQMPPTMLVLCCVAPFMLAVTYWRSSPAFAAAAFLGSLTLLFAIELGRQRFQRRNMESMPLALRFGWLATGTVAAGVAGATRNEALGWAMVALAAVSIMWSYYTRDAVSAVKAAKRFTVTAAVPFVAWLVLLSSTLTLQALVTLGATVVAYGIGADSVRRAWLNRLSSKERLRCIGAAFACASLAATALYVVEPSASGPFIAVLMQLALQQQTALAALDADQVALRGRTLWAVNLVVFVGLIAAMTVLGPQIFATASVGTFFAALTLLTAAFAFRAELRRRDPLQNPP